MKRKKGPLSHIRLIYRRTSPLIKCVVLVAILLSTVALITLRFSIQEQKEQRRLLEQKAAQLQQDNAKLTKEIAQLGTVESVKRIATLELGLVDPDTIFFTPVESPKQSSPAVSPDRPTSPLVICVVAAVVILAAAAGFLLWRYRKTKNSPAINQ